MYNQANENPRNSHVLVGFLCGAAVGAGIALLTAPAEGLTTRKRLADTTRQQFDRVRNRFGAVGRDLKDSVAHARDEMNNTLAR